MSAVPRADLPPADTAVRTPASLAEPAERGRTTVADKVVEKIAAAAAVEVAHAEGLRRQIAGRAVGGPTARAHADVDGASVALRLELAVSYPSPVRAVTRSVRHNVNTQVRRMCAMNIDHIDITVAVLRRPDMQGRRVQ